MFGFLKSLALKTWYYKKMRLSLLLTAMIICFSSYQAKANIVLLENFVGASCDLLIGHQENINTLSEFYDDVVQLSCPMDNTVFEGEYPYDACKIRKRRYQLKDMYTSESPPVVVLNGQYMTSGGFHKIVTSGVNMARSVDDIKTIDLRVEDGQIIGDLPGTVAHDNYDLMVFAIEKQVDSGIELIRQPEHEHNEDGSHADSALDEDEEAHTPIKETIPVQYRNVVKKFDKLGDWDGLAGSFVIPLNGFQADSFMILAQGKDHGPVVAFGKIDWPSNTPNQ